MHRLALGVQALALGHAEAVLLVDHRQGQVGEGHVVLEQGVGAHRHRRLARGQGGELVAALDALVAASQ